jgi:hypothetical protein
MVGYVDIKARAEPAGVAKGKRLLSMEDVVAIAARYLRIFVRRLRTVNIDWPCLRQ